MTKEILVDKADSLFVRYETYKDFFKVDNETLTYIFNQIYNNAVQYRKENKDQNISTKFLDSYITKLSDGTEKGLSYGIYLGGTCIKLFRSELMGNGKISCKNQIFDIKNNEDSGLSNNLMSSQTTASELFDFIVLKIEQLMLENGDITKERNEINFNTTLIPLGFSFAFPLRHSSISSACCIDLSKGWNTGRDTNDPVVSENTDICAFLKFALYKHNLPLKISCVMNDTCSTLMAGSYINNNVGSPTLLSLEFHSGFNISYFDINAHQFGYFGNVINSEIGNTELSKIQNILDFEVDDASTCKGKYLLEKMVACVHIPELCRRSIERVFTSECPKLAWCHHAMSTMACFRIGYDDSQDYEITSFILQKQLEWDQATLNIDKLRIVSSLCKAVIQRGAAIISCSLLAIINLIGRISPATGGVTIAVENSDPKVTVLYIQEIKAYMSKYLKRDVHDLIKFQTISDLNGLGVTILASKLK